MNQTELTEALRRQGVKYDVSTLSRLERGQANLPGDLLHGLVKVLNVGVDWLMDGDSPDVILAFQRFRAVEPLQRALTRLSSWYESSEPSDRIMFERLLDRLADKLTRPETTREQAESAMRRAEEGIVMAAVPSPH